MERLTAHEQAVASAVEQTIREAMSGSERSKWAAQHKIGVSDVGHCREYVRRTLLQSEGEDDPNPMMAFVGTGVGALYEQAYAAAHPEALIQESVVVELEVRDYLLRLPGHPDIIIRADDNSPGEVQDLKTKDGLGVIRYGGPDLQQRFQLTLYGKAAIDMGLVREDVTLSLIYLDRSGREGPRPEVYSWTYDPADLEEAIEWLGDVFYAIENEEEASRDKERTWCEMWCKFAPECRGFSDTDVRGLIEDEEMVKAINLYAEARTRESQAKRDKDAAKAALAGVSGNTEEFSVRWTKVGPAEVPSFTRKGYETLQVTKRKQGKP